MPPSNLDGRKYKNIPFILAQADRGSDCSAQPYTRKPGSMSRLGEGEGEGEGVTALNVTYMVRPHHRISIRRMALPCTVYSPACAAGAT